MSEPSRTDTVERESRHSGFWEPADRSERETAFPPRPGPWGGPRERFADRLRELCGDTRVGIVALVLVALAAGFVWYRLGAGGSPSSPPARRGPTAGAPATTGSATASTASGGSTGAAQKGERVTVHVAGAVVKPGVYDLGAGTRVIDAIEAAGGGVPDADLNRLNLAAKIADGQRVLVQRVGEAAPPGPSSGGGSAAGDGAADPSALVNLNSATSAELEALPGIGPTLAEAIISERERRGGFRSVNELRDVRGIGEKRFADLHDKVTI
ncbi:MAG TPA: ComEA family DNA-binding protein [Acidimicrobiia bacterium]|nr:ComEA family DNA-binding protein [Acidimicrobiia bacterium]